MDGLCDVLKWQKSPNRDCVSSFFLFANTYIAKG